MHWPNIQTADHLIINSRGHPDCVIFVSKIAPKKHFYPDDINERKMIDYLWNLWVSSLLLLSQIVVEILQRKDRTIYRYIFFNWLSGCLLRFTKAQFFFVIQFIIKGLPSHRRRIKNFHLILGAFHLYHFEFIH